MNICLIAGLSCCAAIAPSIVAAEEQSRAATDETNSVQWQRIQSLSTGTQVEVRQFDKKKIKGRLVSVLESGLTISTEGGESSIARSDIRQVRKKSTSARFRSGAIR